jgi:hypothetical protein
MYLDSSEGNRRPLRQFIVFLAHHVSEIKLARLPALLLLIKIQRVVNSLATETADVVNFICFLSIHQVTHAGTKLKIGIQSSSD